MCCAEKVVEMMQLSVKKTWPMRVSALQSLFAISASLVVSINGEKPERIELDTID